MKFIDFDISKVKELFVRNAVFDIMLHDGAVHEDVVLFSFDGENLETIYKFSNLDGDFWEARTVKMYRIKKEH
ncbi:TPA: hypothetical protein OGU99_000743 [Escherichia coli]|nr:hypothetical protein [Escherichia coli]